MSWRLPTYNIVQYCTVKMKGLVLCLFVVIAGLDAHTVQLSDAQKEKVAHYTIDCIKQSGVKPEVIAEVKKGNVPNDEELKKFTLCFFQKTGIIGPDGKLNVDVALSKLPTGVNKADAAKLLEECKTKTEKTSEDTAFEIFKCYRSGTKTHIMF